MSRAYFVLLYFQPNILSCRILKKEKNIDAVLSHKPAFPVVCIGASAGGLESISKFLGHLPSDLGMAYVIVQHLSSDHESILAELLEKRTHMKVHVVSDGMKLEPDNLYVIPPATYMSIVDSHLSLSERNAGEKGHRVIDHFLESLAPVYQNNAIAVILSGVGSDGTIGVQAVKSEGGITFAQDDTALFQGMSRNAYESGYVDFVLSPEGIARELTALSHLQYPLISSDETLTLNERERKKIHTMLLEKFGVDFINYKDTTINRRIMRRMALNKLKDLEEYTKFLRHNGRELDLLYRDLLINVTSFFRDPPLFNNLAKKIFPTLFKNRKPNELVRIWIPGCSSGEEACSIGIALFEFLGEKALHTPIQIFATDLSEQVIEKARSGLYNKNSLQNISPQRLQKFFIKVDGNYQIIKPIRDICIFATHNLVKDPPFSRIDLISCQNLMIYLSFNAQQKVLQAFHYALKPDSFLILGKSETIGHENNLFEQFDKEFKIYQKKATTPHLYFDFFSNSRHTYSDYSKQDKIRTTNTTETDIEKETDKLILSRFSPASVVVNRDMQIIRFQGPISNYLQPASGKASLNLLKMVKDELVFELRTLLSYAKKEGQSTKKENIQIGENNMKREIDIEIIPIKAFSSESFYLIVFNENNTGSVVIKPDMQEARESKKDVKDKRISVLEQDLKEAREHMKSMNEDFEATREELQSANEEILSSNEELQSINEELETSKEELQSTNEELTTINDELQLRNEDLKESVDYVKAIIETIREPLVVINSDLRIRTANKAFKLLFQLDDDTEGYFFYEISNGLLNVPMLRDELTKIISSGISFKDFEMKHDFEKLGGKILLFNAMRLSGEGGKNSRILLAIEDMTEVRQSQENLMESEERFRAIFAQASVGIVMKDLDQKIMLVNQKFCEIVGYSADELTGKKIEEITHPDDLPKNFTSFNQLTKDERPFNIEKRYIRKDGSVVWVNNTVSAIKGFRGQKAALTVVIDISEQKLIELHKDEFIAVASHELKTPVTSIKSYSELLLERLEELKEERGASLARKLYMQVEKMGRLVTDLLDVTKISKGQLELERQTFGVRELLSKCIEEMQLVSPKHKLILELSDDRMIYADKERLEQVLVNLISNAIKYSPVSTSIVITCEVQSDFLYINVKDAGIGMTERTMLKVFDRFYRGDDNISSNYPGLGLGLFIAAEIIRKHGGNIWVKSQKNKGTLFSFSIPLTNKSLS